MISDLLDDLGRNSCHERVGGDILGDYSARSNNAMGTDSDARNNRNIGPNHHVVFYDNWFDGDTLSIDRLVGIIEVMNQGGNDCPLPSATVITNGYRTDDGLVKANPGVVANYDIAYGIVDTSKRFHNTVITKGELSVWGSVHSY